MNQNRQNSNQSNMRESSGVSGSFGSFLVRYQQQIWGFIAWYIGTSVLAPFSLGLITTPATLLCLFAFAISKDLKGIAGGILIALSMNFVISLVLGLSFNAFCFVPFYYGDLLIF